MAFPVILGFGLVGYFVLLSIYRLFFHPLSHIPGPKLAAICDWYEFYYNIVKGGKFIWEIQRWHDKYGPIVRINPREVHILDPDYYDEIYSSNARRRNKVPKTVAQFDLDGSGFSAIDTESHRPRRQLMDKFFSKRAIENTQDLIQSRIDKLVHYIDKAHRTHSVVGLDAGFAALTSDIIYQYVYEYDPQSLDKEEFNAHIRDGINGMFRNGHLLYFFPVLRMLMNLVPVGLLQHLSPPLFALAKQKEDLYQRGVQALKDAASIGDKKTNIPIHALAATNLPEHMRAPIRLMNEGFALIIGGTETTARTLAVGAWHIYSRDDIRQKLREELRTVMPTPDSRPGWNELEKLPYLSGVVLESLRLSTGIASRSPRTAPTEALVYNGHVLPPGTIISQTHYLLLMDLRTFPNPDDFDPERWGRAAAKGIRLEKYLVNFSKGSRICLGFNLAYAELFMAIATIVRKFDLELYKTPKATIELSRDFGTPWPEEGALSVRATVAQVITE